MVTATNTIGGTPSSGASEVKNPDYNSATNLIRVSVVEDNEQLRRALVFQLATAGFEVTPHSSAEEFLKVADASICDCIVVDNFLPRMNGLQLQAELHRTAPFASIVFISGHGNLSLGMQAIRKGAVDFLEKPIDDEALLRSIFRGAELIARQGTRRVNAQRHRSSNGVSKHCAPYTARARGLCPSHGRSVEQTGGRCRDGYY